MTVYRQLSIQIGRPWSRGDYRPIGKFWGFFLKNVNFSRIKVIFWEFFLLKLVNARAHARGFALL